MKKEFNCRVSGQPLIEVIDFGKQPLGNGFLKEKDFESEYFFDMKVGFCEKSKMLQLIEQPSASKMFHEEYPFFSSSSQFMGVHFQDLYKSVIESKFFKSDDPFVVELGCNDGILLKHFSNAGIRHLGIEPSLNVAEIARKNNVNTVNEFFSEKLVQNILDENGAADIFLSANVMCHISNIKEVVSGIKKLMKKKGVVIFEDPYLGDIVQKNSYDQIYDEHVFLFSGMSVNNLFNKFDMELIDVQPQKTHGGSMRYFLANKNEYEISLNVSNLLENEKLIGLDDKKTFFDLHEKIKKSKEKILSILNSLKEEGKSVAGYAATSKSTTILNYCGVNSDLIEYISDTTPIKQGKFSPGMHIPIKPYKYFKDNSPDYAFLLAWNHIDEIMQKEIEFTQNGGKWISHVPEVRII